MEKKQMASPSNIEWVDGGHKWGLASDHKPEKEFFLSILRGKKLLDPELNKSKAKPFEKLFVQKGLYDGTKVLVDRELTDLEKKGINNAVKSEMEKYPHMKIVCLVGEDQKGKIRVEFVHKTRPKKSMIEKIDSMIELEKAKLKKR